MLINLRAFFFSLCYFHFFYPSIISRITFIPHQFYLIFLILLQIPSFKFLKTSLIRYFLSKISLIILHLYQACFIFSFKNFLNIPHVRHQNHLHFSQTSISYYKYHLNFFEVSSISLLNFCKNLF